MHEHRKDVDRTKALRSLRIFTDPRSYVSNAGHIFLRGEDRSEQRERLIREQGLLCALCGQPMQAWEAEMDHIAGGRKHLRCDCLRTRLADGSRHTNLRMVHGRFSKSQCHAIKHRRLLSHEMAHRG